MAKFCSLELNFLNEALRLLGIAGKVPLSFCFLAGVFLAEKV